MINKITIMATTSTSAKALSYEMLSESQCRICLRNPGLLPIFGDDKKPDISLEIAMFGGVQLFEDDDFPKHICPQCFNQLQGAIIFRQSAKRSDALFKRKLKNKKKRTISTQYDIQNQPIKTEENVDSAKDGVNEMQFEEVKIDANYAVRDDSKTTVVSDLKTEYIVDVSVERENLNDGETIENDFEDNGNDNENFQNENIENDNESFKNSDELNHSPVVMIIVDDGKKPFSCNICGKDFQESEALEEHQQTVEHKQNYVMRFLPKKKKTSEEKKTVNPKDKKCEICNRWFTKLHYPRHMQTQHKIQMETSRSTKKKECMVCLKMFHPVALIRHMKKAHGDEKDHTPKAKLECPICKKLFSKDFYPLHMARHTQGDNKNYICDQCGKKFFFKSTFYSHKLIHSNNLPHKCEYCPYRGRTKGLLKTHVRTHTGDYPYKCTQCDTKCLTKSNLNAHMLRHRGPVDFICDSCNRGFYSKLDLQRHISVIHLGVRDHVCNICGVAFGYRHGLMSHQLNVHKRAKGMGKAKAVYLKLEEESSLQSQQSSE